MSCVAGRDDTTILPRQSSKSGNPIFFLNCVMDLKEDVKAYIIFVIFRGVLETCANSAVTIPFLTNGAHKAVPGWYVS